METPMIQQNIYSPDQGTQKNPGNSAFVSKLDPSRLSRQRKTKEHNGREQLRRSWEA